MIYKILSMALMVPFVALVLSSILNIICGNDDETIEVFFGLVIWLYLAEAFGVGLYLLFK